MPGRTLGPTGQVVSVPLITAKKLLAEHSVTWP